MALWAGGMFYRLNGDLPKVVVLLTHERKFWLQNCHLKCIFWFCGSKSEHYRFSVCFGESTEEIIPIGGIFASGYFYPVQIFNKTPGFVFWSKSRHREQTFLKHEACECELLQYVWIAYGSLWSLLHFAIVWLKSSSAKVLALDKCD